MQSIPSASLQPGDLVSVDQMVAPTTHGLVTQMKCKLRKARYRDATIFVDQVSRLGYVHLQTTDSATEMLKISF